MSRFPIYVELADKSKMKDAYGDAIHIRSDTYRDAMDKMSQEDLYDLILESHEDVFTLPDGRSLKRMLLDASWDSIKANQAIPANLRNYWANLPAGERSGAIVRYQEACSKFEDYMLSVVNQAAAAGRSQQEVESLMNSIIPALTTSFHEISDSIAQGHRVDASMINNTIRGNVQAGAATIDPNSETYAFYTSVMQHFDPVTHTWINC